MRGAAFTAIMCLLLSGAALAQQSQTPAERLENVYTNYMVAQRCAEKTLVFSPDDLAKLTAAMRPYAQATGLSQAERDEQWENAKKNFLVPAGTPELDFDKKSCVTVRAELAKTFPGVLPKISDNPF